MSAELDDVEMENVLQQIFMECEASMSASTTPDSAVSTSEDIPVSRIIEYIRDQLPSWSIENLNLVELWKCLVASSANERLNLRQFKQATKRWITKVDLQMPFLQDGNNNAREGAYIANDADPSMNMDVDKDVIEVELRMRLREVNEENMLFRDELERHEATIENLKLQCNLNGKQLNRYVQKCQQQEKENDEQRDKFDETVRNEKALTLAVRRCTRDYKDLLKQLEAVEIEVQAIPSLKDKMEKISKEKTDCLRQITRLQEEFDEKEDECKQLKDTMIELKDTNNNMREVYESTIRNLREKNRQLSDENMELQSLSILNGEMHSVSSIPDIDNCCTHSTPYKPEKVARQDSLYAELKASGFNATECSKNDSCRLALEEELEQYDTAISAVSEQLEKVVETFVAMRGSLDDLVPRTNPQDMHAKTRDIEALEHKVAFLQRMATKEITKMRSTVDASTQLRIDSASTTEDLHRLGVTSFHDAMTRAQPCAKAKTDLWPITSRCVKNNEDDDGDPFSRVTRAFTDARIIDPIVEELNEIIESTLTSLAGRSTYENSRHRSIHTLPSGSETLQSSSSNEEDSDCQSSRTNSLSALLARGDVPKLENPDEKSIAEMSRGDVSDQEESFSLDSRNEMPKVASTLQIDPEALNGIASTEMNSKSSEVPEANNSASKPASPRRKISVYCRSFDVVAMQDSRFADQGADLATSTRQSTSSSAAQASKRINEEATVMKDQSDPFKYQFNHSYRDVKNDSGSSSGSTPQKKSDSPLEDEPLMEQSVPRRVHLAPTRLKLVQQGVKDELNVIADCASSAFNGGSEKNDNSSARSSSTSVVDERDVLDSVPFETELHSAASEDLSQEQLTPFHSIPHDRSDSAKFADPEGRPHSRASVLETGSESQLVPQQVERSVDNQMSSREDSSIGSDSEYDAAATGSGVRCVRRAANGTDRASAGASSIVSPTLSRDSAFTRVVPCKNVIQNDGRTCDKDEKQTRRQRLLIIRRSYSEGERKSQPECHCERNDGARDTASIQREDQPRIFPSLTDIRLQESGIANLSDTELGSKDNLNELELQKRYTAFSLCLCTDRVTLPQRVAMSLRQRDQSEKNLFSEVQKMQQDIQDLAPLCTDRESVERLERVRHQLDMVARCAHRVSCVAETLGAVHQELRVSRAVLLADRYLQVLLSRCEKLASNIAETKRILIENNIVIEENSAELSDDLPRIRYRSTTPVNNRMMMARRRASIATISRPIGAQDVIKEAARQRNSVSGRMTLRRPSFNSESPKWEIEKLSRTDSSNSISELRGIFEQAESRRGSREENNNMLRLSHCNSRNIINCTVDEIWPSEKQDTSPKHLAIDENDDPDYSSRLLSSQAFCLRNVSWRTILWSILIFFLGFFVSQTMSNMCHGTLNVWSIEEILSRYVRRNTAPHPM